MARRPRPPGCDLADRRDATSERSENEWPAEHGRLESLQTFLDAPKERFGYCYDA